MTVSNHRLMPDPVDGFHSSFTCGVEKKGIVGEGLASSISGLCFSEP